MERSTRFLYWLVLAVALFGSYCFVGTVWWPLYFEALQAHLLLGALLYVVMLPIAAWHVRKTGTSVTKALVVPAAVMAALFVLIPGRPEYPALGPIAWASGITCIQLLLTAAIASRISSAHTAPVVTSISGVVLTVICFWGLNLGVLGWFLRGDERWGPMLAHSAFGVFCLALLFPHLKSFRRLVRRSWGIPISAGVLTLLGWWWHASYPHDLILADFASPMDFRQERMFSADSATQDRAVTTTPKNRAERDAGVHPKLDETLVANSASCGSSGCHEALYQQWSGSAHRFAADNDFYQAVVAEYVKDRGPSEATFCANCHDPVRVLTGTVEEAYADGAPPPGDGVSCVACHAALDAPEINNGVLQVREPRPYPGDTVETQHRNIALDPRPHRQDLVSNFRMGEPQRICVSCHILQLSPDMGAMTKDQIQAAATSGSQKPGELACTDCHMPTLTFERSFEQAKYDHFVSGIGLDFELFANHPEADHQAIRAARANTVEFLEGKLNLKGLIGEKRVYEIADETAQILRSGGALSMAIEAHRSDSGRLKIEVTSANTRAGHPFPIGPFDLNEVWQEVEVIDATGNRLFHVGGLDERKRVDPTANRLGADELDRDGHHIKHHRIWDIAAVTNRRQIPQGGSVQHRYEVDLPEEVSTPLKLVARWRYRRVNPDFSDWVYGEGVKTFPAHEIAVTRSELQ